MRFNKSTTALCAIVIGALVLVTSAFADVMIGSGYHNLKNSAKTTMAKLTTEVDNFSVDVIASVKVDGERFAEGNSKIKYDIANQASESHEKNFDSGKTREYYNYVDSKQNISRNFEKDSYHVYSKENDIRNKNTKEFKVLDNVFEEERVADAEKIVDAFVGSLQDIIQVEEIDNKKMYIGNLSGTQVPPLINAISSFTLKYSIFNERESKRLKIPYPKTDIYVIDASGKAIENKDGILENILFSGNMSATDEYGVEHIYSVELSIEVKDINNTIVQAPNLEGQEVEYGQYRGPGLDEKHIGTYKNNIVEEKENSFVKVGERILEITNVQEKSIEGRYYEAYYDGYRPDKMRSFDLFIDTDNKEYHYLTFKYIDNDGKEKTGIIHTGRLQNISINLDVELSDGGGYSYNNYEDDFDSEFIRIFE